MVAAMATCVQILQMQVLAKIFAILASTYIPQTANVALKLWLAQVKFGKYDKNRYSWKASLASVHKFGKFSKCRLDCF
jgi:hypothetical protein